MDQTNPIEFLKKNISNTKCSEKYYNLYNEIAKQTFIFTSIKFYIIT